jgi:hypothetical protein
MDSSSMPMSVFDGYTLTFFVRLQADQNYVSQASIRLLGKYNSQPGEVVLGELTLEFIEDLANTVPRMRAN